MQVGEQDKTSIHMLYVQIVSILKEELEGQDHLSNVIIHKSTYLDYNTLYNYAVEKGLIMKIERPTKNNLIDMILDWQESLEGLQSPTTNQSRCYRFDDTNNTTSPYRLPQINQSRCYRFDDTNNTTSPYRLSPRQSRRYLFNDTNILINESL